jgi:hypothetical protein
VHSFTFIETNRTSCAHHPTGDGCILPFSGVATNKNPLIGGFIKLWQHIKYASNMAYFVAFCKRV